MDQSVGWLAGIIDGEGCLSLEITRQPSGGRGFRATVVVVNIHLPTIVKAQAIALTHGVRSIIYDRQPPSQKHRLQYRLSFQGHQTKELLDVVYPWLVTKKAQADVLLAFFDWRKGYKPRWGGLHGHNGPAIEAERIVREYSDKIKTLRKEKQSADSG